MERTEKAKPQYIQHRPEQTLLFEVVRDNLVPFLQHTKSIYKNGIPRYVEKELREYLKCGIHAHGFARARCQSCNHEILVAFSCKKRGVCPSCNGRRMSDTAARLVDRVLPDVRLRQWVLSIPFELRVLLAREPSVLSAFGRIFVQEIFRWQRGKAMLWGLARGGQQVRGAAVNFPQRFGGSLNLNVHFHVVVPDAFFYRDGSGGVGKMLLQKPSTVELSEITHNVAVRCCRWLGRHGFLQTESDDVEHRQIPSAMDACLQGSVGLGKLIEMTASGNTRKQGGPKTSVGSKRVKAGEFNIHAGVTAQTKEERERLIRYCARPPLSLERLSKTPDGQIAYKLRKPIRGRTHRLLAPMEFLARLSALIPPPRHPLIRFHGVVAPNSSWRSEVIPQSREKELGNADNSASNPALSPRQLLPPNEDGALKQSLLDEQDWQNTRLDWATLLKRVYNIDALACPCGGRLRFEELVIERDKVREHLRQRGLGPEPHRPKQRETPSDCDAYAPVPEEDWDQRPRLASSPGGGDVFQTESDQIEPDDPNDWDQRQQGSEESDWDQRNEGSDEETSLSDADVPKTIFDDG